MEFKVFKNKNNKILKEYWLTQSEWDALDKTTVQEGDIYHIVGTIDKGDLSADVNASLAKADSSLQKPTATLAKRSFVTVGINGSQEFDESSYAALDADQSNDFSSTNTFFGKVRFKGDSEHQAIFYPETAKIVKSYSLIEDVDNPTSEMTVKYCNPNTKYPSAQLQYAYNPQPEYNGGMGVEFVQDGNYMHHATLGITQWFAGFDNIEPMYQSMFMDLGRNGTASIIVNDYDKNEPNNPLASSTYKFRKNNTTNTVATLNDLIEDDTKTCITFKGINFPGNDNFYVNKGAVIDWGDGTIQTVTGDPYEKVSHTYRGENLYRIVISNLLIISNVAFSDCLGLLDFKLGSTVTEIGGSAFQNTGISSITIPKTITQMELLWIFAQCTDLKTVRVLSETPLTVQPEIFEGSPIEKIIVPKSAINDYKSAAGWSTYADKIVYEVDSSDLGNVEMDTEMSDQSTNGVQNKVIKAYIDGSIFTNGIPATKILYSGDFSKTVETAISCRVYWGDGTFTDYTNATDISHTYSGQLTVHTISIAGLTSIPDSMFVGDTELYEIALGVGVNADMICFADCTNLKTIRIQDNNADTLPITANDMSVFTYNFDYAKFRIVVPRLLYMKLLENNADISTEFIWNFVVPDDSYICSHSIRLSGSNNATYEVMLYSTCKLPLNQVPLATNPSTGIDQKRDILRELIDGEIAYKYSGSSGDLLEGLGSLIYSDSDDKYHISLSTTLGGHAKTDEAFDLTEIISDIVKLK